jgi:hypothetical protein
LQKELQQFNESKLAFWNEDEPSDGAKATKMVTLWSDSTAFGAGQVPTRGLGGRIYFYDEKNKPIKIDGELMIYAYDDDVAKEDSRPTRKFVFSADQFQKHLSESDFGPSYSVWLPWDTVGNQRKSISLVPVFKTASGRILMGDHSRNVLPGQSEDLEKKTTTYQLSQQQQREKPSSAVRPVSYDEKDASDESGRRRINRITIPVHQTMRQRLMSIGEQTSLGTWQEALQTYRTLGEPAPHEPAAEQDASGASNTQTVAPTSDQPTHSLNRQQPAGEGVPMTPRRPVRPRRKIRRAPTVPIHEPTGDPAPS